MPTLPTGTVTFLFTDIEGSTRLWEEHPQTMRVALARHDALMREAIEQHDGDIFKTIGDAFCAAFHTAPDALASALAAQQALTSEVWPIPINIKVRMALHTGTAEARDNDYFGHPLNRVARLLAAGHGGQVLLSLATEELTRDTLPPAVSLKGLGEHRLRDLTRPETVFQLLHPALLAEFPPLKSLDNPNLPNNLPRQLTSFIGREKEISLAPLTDPALVPQTVASVLGLAEQAGKPYTKILIESLRAKSLFLVLDNCEHVLTGCVHLSDAVLHSCPNVKILASSREGLGIAGELTFRVPPLSLPDLKQAATIESVSQYEAVRLFIERALFHLPTFTVTNNNAPALANLCNQLDGIPLAIELATARVGLLSVEEINNRLNDRFRLLTGGNKTALPRQQTLRATIDWSYDLLSDQERWIVQRLSVFLGGWSLEAAEAICADEEVEAGQILDLLASLVDKSLVIAEHNEEHTRYRFLETMRQYCRERFEREGQALNVQKRHRAFYLHIAQEAEGHLVGTERLNWLDLLEREHDNLRSALDSCSSDGDSRTDELQLVGALWPFWIGQGYWAEGRRRLETALEHNADVDTLEKAKALLGAATLTRNEGNEKQARLVFQQCLSLSNQLGAKRESAWALVALGDIARQIGSDNEEAPFERMTTLCQEAIALFREIGDKQGIDQCLRFLSVTAPPEECRDMLEESLMLSQEIGDMNGVAATLFRQASIEAFSNIEQAQALYERSLALYETAKNKKGMALVLGALSNVAAMNGIEVNIRIDLHRRALALCREIGDKKQAAQHLMQLGHMGNDNDQKIHFLVEAIGLCKEIAISSWQATLLDALGNIALEQRQYRKARSYFLEALALRRNSEPQSDLILSLTSFESLAAATGQIMKRIRLWSVIEAHSAMDFGRLFLTEENEAESKRKMDEVRDQVGEDAFVAAWEEGQIMTLEQAVEYALEEE